MYFRILGEIIDVETIATGSGIRELPRLQRRYGRARSRKHKGTAQVELADGVVRLAEITGTKRQG